MSISTIQNFYKETITRAVTLTGATNIYVSALPTPDEGYVVISPSSSSLREIVYYTAKGTDSNGTYLTVTLANRGLGGTTAQTHAIGEPVRMNVTAEHIQEISDAIDQIVASGAQNASTITKGISKLSVAPASATEPIAVGTNDPRVPTANPTTLFAPINFGGTGADGALAITSGTTTIDLGGAKIFTKNYTSISITGSGQLAFSNPHPTGTLIVLKSQGDVTLTSSATPNIDASGMGGNTRQPGVTGDNYYTNPGVNGTSDGAAAGGAIPTVSFANFSGSPTAFKYRSLIGAGGGSGMATHTTGSGEVAGVGGRGGGGLVIECAGAWNFTTTAGISVAGKNGTDGTGGAGTAASGGGGGGGGSLIALYNTLTANSGTVTISGGVGGLNANLGSLNNQWGGSGGGGLTAGSNSTHSLSSGVKTGGDGGNGFSLVAQNTELN